MRPPHRTGDRTLDTIFVDIYKRLGAGQEVRSSAPPITITRSARTTFGSSGGSSRAAGTNFWAYDTMADAISASSPEVGDVVHVPVAGDLQGGIFDVCDTGTPDGVFTFAAASGLLCRQWDGFHALATWGGAATDGTTETTDSIMSVASILSAGGGGMLIFPELTFTVGNLRLYSNVAYVGQGMSSILAAVDNIVDNPYGYASTDDDVSLKYPGCVLTTLDRYDQNKDQSFYATGESTARAAKYPEEKTSADYAVENVLISGLKLVGTQTTPNTTENGQNLSAMQNVITLYQCRNMVVDNCWIEGATKDGIHLGYSLQGGADNCKITNSHFKDNVRTHIAIVTGCDNVVSNCTLEGETSVSSIDIEPNLQFELSARNVVTGCSVPEGGIAIQSQKSSEYTSARCWDNAVIGCTFGKRPVFNANVAQGSVFVGCSFTGPGTDDTTAWGGSGPDERTAIGASGPNFKVAATGDITWDTAAEGPQTDSWSHRHVLFQNCTFNDFPRITENVSQGAHGWFKVQNCTFRVAQGIRLSRPYEVVFEDNVIELVDSTNNMAKALLRIGFDNQATVPYQGRVSFVRNRVIGDGNMSELLDVSLNRDEYNAATEYDDTATVAKGPYARVWYRSTATVGNQWHLYQSLVTDNLGNTPPASGANAYWSQIDLEPSQHSVLIEGNDISVPSAWPHNLDGVWSSGEDYGNGTVVQGSDSNFYEAQTASGPNNGGAKDPTTGANRPTYWIQVTEKVRGLTFNKIGATLRGNTWVGWAGGVAEGDDTDGYTLEGNTLTAHSLATAVSGKGTVFGVDRSGFTTSDLIYTVRNENNNYRPTIVGNTFIHCDLALQRPFLGDVAYNRVVNGIVYVTHSYTTAASVGTNHAGSNRFFYNMVHNDLSTGSGHIPSTQQSFLVVEGTDFDEANFLDNDVWAFCGGRGGGGVGFGSTYAANVLNTMANYLDRPPDAWIVAYSKAAHLAGDTGKLHIDSNNVLHLSQLGTDDINLQPGTDASVNIINETGASIFAKFIQGQQALSVMNETVTPSAASGTTSIVLGMGDQEQGDRVEAIQLTKAATNRSHLILNSMIGLGSGTPATAGTAYTGLKLIAVTSPSNQALTWAPDHLQVGGSEPTVGDANYAFRVYDGNADLEKGIKLGASAVAAESTLEYDTVGNKFRGHDNTGWKNLLFAGDETTSTASITYDNEADITLKTASGTYELILGTPITSSIPAIKSSNRLLLRAQAGNLDLDASGDVNIRSETGTARAIFVSGGGFTNYGNIGVTSGNHYEVNSVQVVGAQGAAVADTTDTSDAATQLNTLLARLRAHGLIAT